MSLYVLSCRVKKKSGGKCILMRHIFSTHLHFLTSAVNADGLLQCCWLLKLSFNSSETNNFNFLLYLQTNHIYQKRHLPTAMIWYTYNLQTVCVISTLRSKMLGHLFSYHWQQGLWQSHESELNSLTLQAYIKYFPHCLRHKCTIQKH